MAKLLKLRRGTNTQHSSFTGAEGEVTVNTTNDSLHVHDGTTAGGTEMAKADLSNAAGASVPGTLTVNKLVVDDDGSGGALCRIAGDDGTPWAFVVGNDTYSTDENDGLRVYQGDTGTITMDIKGDSSYEDFNIRANNGTTAQNCLRITAGREVTLHHEGAQKCQTTSTGIDVTGTVTCDGLSCVGDATIESGSGILYLKDNNSSGDPAEIFIQARDSQDANQWYFGAGTNAELQVWNYKDGSMNFATNNTIRAKFKNDGHFVPHANNTYDIGGSSAQWRDAYFDGTVNCDGLSCNGSATIESGVGILSLKDNNNTGNSTENYIQGTDSGGTQKWYLGYASTSNQDLYLSNVAGGQIRFRSSNSDRIFMQADGHFVPASNDSIDLGSSSNRWRNVYTNDLNLSNEGGANDVDGTWGSWTIQEGEDDLFLLNRRNGKKYKFNLSEVN